MPRRLFHVLALIAVAFASLGVLLVAGAWLYLHTPPGRRFVLGMLGEAFPGVELDARRLSGSVFTDLRLDDVTARPRGAGPLLHAASIEARYKPLSLLLGDRRVELDLRDARSGPVHADLEAYGPLDSLFVKGLARSGKGTLSVSGTVDATQGKADLRATFDDFPIESAAAAATIIATGSAQIRAARREDGLSFVANGKGRYSRRETQDAHGEVLPGGHFVLRADGIQRQGQLKADFELDLAEAGQAARLLENARLVSPSKMNTRVRGSLTIPPDGQPRLTAEVVPR